MSVLKPKRAEKPCVHHEDNTVLRLVIGRGGFIGELSVVRPTDDLLRWQRALPLYMFTEFYVHPLRRGMGWGTKLLDSMCAWADRRGWDLITYPRAYGNGARPNNEMLRSLYCGWGFRTLPSNPTYMVRRCR